jgi:hypothetical protein
MPASPRRWQLESTFPFYVPWANLFEGRSSAALGHSKEGFTLIANSLSMMRATGAVIGTPMALMMLAEVDDALGRQSEALNCVAEAVQIIEANDERWLASEVLRLRGSLLKAGGDLAAAEDSYSKAIAVALEQAQGSLSCAPLPISRGSGATRASGMR